MQFARNKNAIQIVALCEISIFFLKFKSNRYEKSQTIHQKLEGQITYLRMVIGQFKLCEGRSSNPGSNSVSSNPDLFEAELKRFFEKI